MTSGRTSAVENASSWMTTPPARTLFRSARQVATLKAIRMSTLSDRAMWPSGVMRSWYQVGRSSMFEGKTFFGATEIPMWKIALVRTRLAVWLPEPLTVAAWMVRSLTMGSVTSISGMADLGFYAPAGLGLNSLESSSREGGRPQGERAGRAPRSPRSRDGEDAGGCRPGGQRRGRRRRDRVHNRRSLREGGSSRRKQGRDHAPRRRRGAEGAGPARERDLPAQEGRVAHQLPAAGDPGGHRQVPGRSRHHGVQPRAPSANQPRPVDGRAFVAGVGSRLQGGADGRGPDRQAVSDDDDRGGNRRSDAGPRDGRRGCRAAGDRHGAASWRGRVGV